jgi:arginase
VVGSVADRLDLVLPEWQGYGEDHSASAGALSLREHLAPALSFATVDIPTHERLKVENDILGYRANLRILEQARVLIENDDPATIFLVGGTCASEIAPVSFLNKKYHRDVTLLWFDAHGDLNTPQSSSSKHFHGMPLRMLLGDGPKEVQALVFESLSCSQVVLAGSRDLDPPEVAYVKENQITSLPAAELASRGALTSAIRKSGSSNLYIHVDLDVLEPKDFPHVLIPTPGGVEFEDLMVVLRQLRDEFLVVGSSIIEYVPIGKGDPERMQRLAEVLRPQGLP